MVEKHAEETLGVAVAAGVGALVLGGAVAWARRRGDGAPRKAPGGPGEPPRWFDSSKDGVGTAVNPAVGSSSLVWFTLGRGILSEVFYPRLDCACTRDLGLIVTDGRSYFSEEQHDAEHRVEAPADGVPLFTQVNTCKRGRYRIEATTFTHPRQDAVLRRVRFTPLDGGLGDYHLYALLNPHVARRGDGDTAWVGDHKGMPMLFAERVGHAVALACSSPWIDASAGFVGVSDGWQDLARHGRLTRHYDRAERGNVALVGEIDPSASGGGFTMALGFGPNPAEAGHRALASLLDDPDALRAEYVGGWRDWLGRLAPDGPLPGGGRDLYGTSAAVLRTHESKAVPGAAVASLTVPWGEARGDETELGTGGYHLVWPRDQSETAGGLLAAGASADAARILGYLRATQMADGHWPQNMWVGGAPYWDGIQLGETAIPILLLDALRLHGGLGIAEADAYWPMVRRAAAYLVRSGPSSQQDRWENQRGYTPFTLALVVSALLVAADMAEAHGEAGVAPHLRETADAWNSAVESWLYVTDTDLARRHGVAGYYVRVVTPDSDEVSTPKTGRLVLEGAPPEHRGIPITEIVSVDALALVRYGLRAPDDPRILDTIKVIDATLKVETPSGPCWHRYTHDGYGEHADGSPYVGKARGIGRAWPLLVGERAHYELEAGRRDEAVRLLRAMAAFANEGGMIPEQVWDTGDIPERGLFKGRPSGSAMPLAWAHAEYLKLRRSLRDGTTFDRPPRTARRYLEQKVTSDLVLWRFDHPVRHISAGEALRLEVLAPALVRWGPGGGKSDNETPTRDTGLGLHVADLATESLSRGDRVRFTFRWTESDRWEGRDFEVGVI